MIFRRETCALGRSGFCNMYLTMRCEVWRIANAPGVEQPDTSQHKQVTRKDLKERKSPQARQIISTNSLSMEGRLSAWLLAILMKSYRICPEKGGKSMQILPATQSDPGQSVCDRSANKIFRRGGDTARATWFRVFVGQCWPLMLHYLGFIFLDNSASEG